MRIPEALFDIFSASVGASFGVLVGFILNRGRTKKMANQIIVSKTALEKIKIENQELLKRIQDKENIILQMQMQILGDNVTHPKKTVKKRKKTIA